MVSNMSGSLAVDCEGNDRIAFDDYRRDAVTSHKRKKTHMPPKVISTVGSFKGSAGGRTLRPHNKNPFPATLSQSNKNGEEESNSL